MCVNSTLESQSALERATGLSREVLLLQFGGQGSMALASAAHARWTLMNSTAQAVAAWALLARPHATL